MKQQLVELYQLHQISFEELFSTHSTAHLSSPFLMSPGESYANSKRKLLIVGQDTCGWGCPTQSIAEHMDGYEGFNLGKHYKLTPFWKMVRIIERHLNNAECTCAWTNINRFDVNRKRPRGEYATSISQFDSLLLEEIRIIKPEVCLFLTGYAFDQRIKNIFQGVVFQPVDNIDARCTITRIAHSDLPALSFKIYHPGYLRRKRLEKVYTEALSALMI